MPATVVQPAKWNAADYAANSSVQQIWARELIAKLKLRGHERILDVGCGDGKVTAEIARALPGGSATGVDASAEMIAFAQKAFSPSAVANLTFRVCDARKISPVDWFSPSPPQKEERAGERRHLISNSNPLVMNLLGAPASRRPVGSQRTELAGETPALPGTAPFDIVFSNATLHWVDDHQAFLRGAASVLSAGGRLVVSCGGKGNAQDVFLALRPELRLTRWRPFFRRMPRPYFFYSPDDYEKWLPRFGFNPIRVRLAPKDATYEGRDGLAAWLRTTWLPYVQRVPEGLRGEFIAAVAERYTTRHPPDADGKIHVRMVRLEIDAVKV